MIFCSYCSDGLDAGITHCPRCFRPAGSATKGSISTLEPFPDESAADAIRAADIALIQADADAKLAAEIERVRAEAAHQRVTELARLREEADAIRDATITQVRASAEAETRGALAAELAKARSEAEQVFAAELALVRAEAEQALTSRLQRAEEEASLARNAQLALAAAEAEALRAAAVEEARRAAEEKAARALEAESARVRAEATARLEAELARLRQSAGQAKPAEQEVKGEAEWARESVALSLSREDAGDVHVLPSISDNEIPPEWQGGATYTLELPARCPYCREIIRTLRVLRLKRSQAAFTSPLPRGGRTILCSACDGILSADLSTL